MKKLILIRHAKSSWEFNLNDHERPLKSRGVTDANLVSKKLCYALKTIDLVLCSDAQRTKLTAEIFISALGIEENLVKFNPNLYDFSGENLVRIVKDVHDSVNNLMVFGHNHAITAFVNTFGTKHIDNVPTSGVVIIEFDIEKWSALKPGKTLKTIFPRDLK
ncbi:histidine phosphatase family protein [Algibacter amylolyticus]|uniref:Histidine phosphatase family protein n=1 Tax=Algibacter amylolyticus TaxID=1608400 RepID=A0A5M7AXZ6_9FLAO|nr:histidine phosphatase family protein [Algibacter amylolyticus]KAA5821490.1 histidine phosphatase family protein [Algibacter amylolyticus]MBB5268367.1 phosphohistidine phosphatase [Algibacter amylolyticus]TSJ73002.1 histidine phosphatase family protein [Algibacter amylolyticus]